MFASGRCIVAIFIRIDNLPLALAFEDGTAVALTLVLLGSEAGVVFVSHHLAASWLVGRAGCRVVGGRRSEEGAGGYYQKVLW
jgi:hypothetical protein